MLNWPTQDVACERALMCIQCRHGARLPIADCDIFGLIAGAHVCFQGTVTVTFIADGLAGCVHPMIAGVWVIHSVVQQHHVCELLLDCATLWVLPLGKI